jgi:hypothetical protein
MAAQRSQIQSCTLDLATADSGRRELARVRFEVAMKWQTLLLALIRCELKARYDRWGWQLSAHGALPVVLIGLCVLVWMAHR